MSRKLSRALLLLLAGAALSACQTMPRPAASVPSPLSDGEYARTTELPPEALSAPGTPLLPSETTGAEVFARLQAGFRAPVCTGGELSTRWQHRYAGSPRVFAQHLQNILPMLDFVSKEVQTSGLPTEFALIPLVESWYRPEAIGLGGPAGMWQLIASTAKNNGIRIQNGYDGRLSPVESTRAALSYLKTLHDMFNDWQATVMAYNAGEYRLIHAFERNGKRDVSGELRQPQGLSNITYDYVAKLQALSCLISEPQRQGLQLPSDTRFKKLAPVLVDEKINALDQVAAQTGIDKGTLHALNPGYRSGRLVAGVPRLVLMPSQAGLTQSLASPELTVALASAEPLASAQASTNAIVQPDVIPTAETAVASAITQPIVIPSPEISVAAATTSEANSTPASHEVRNGDTLWAIAKRYGTTIDALRRINGLGKKAQLKPGQSLKLLP